MTKKKKCTKCGVPKPLTDFHWRKSAKDGKWNQCRMCHNEQQRKYYETNREKYRERNRKYREANPEAARKWREANPEKVREQNREGNRKYRAANPEKVREQAREKNRKCRRRQAVARQLLTIVAAIDAMKQVLTEIDQTDDKRRAN